MKLLDGVRGEAMVSADGAYRYWLSRFWTGGVLAHRKPGRHEPHVVWIMLNPSTASADEDDQTLRQIQSFTRRWGYGGLVVVNLFALRATQPKDLRAHPYPVSEARGPSRNRDHLVEQATHPNAARVVAAWGNHGRWKGRGAAVTRVLQARVVPLWRLGELTKQGQPRHPLRESLDLQLEPHP